MAQMTGQEKYRSDVERYANHLLDRQKTNADGILYVHKWGTLRLGLFSTILSANNFSPNHPPKSFSQTVRALTISGQKRLLKT